MGEPGEEEGETGEPGGVYRRLKRTVREEFPEAVSGVVVERDPGDTPRNLRVFLVDGSFLDAWISGDRYSYHWQSGDSVVRFDDAPHHPDVETHPHHVHVEGGVRSSPLEGRPEEDISEVFRFLLEERVKVEQR